MPTFDAPTIARLLRASSLCQAEAAAIAIQEHLPIEADAFDVQACGLAATYGARLRGLQAKSSPHSRQLAASVGELCVNLRVFRGQACWVTISGIGPKKFQVLVAADASQALGCMLTVGRFDVTDAEWAHLWDDGRHN